MSIHIQSVEDLSFKKYGKVIKGEYDLVPLMKEMEQEKLTEGVIYEPSVEVLERLPVALEIETRFYGELPIQIGYCNGHNHLLNAVEYHRSSEINIAITDMILLLGKEQDITEEYTYDTNLIEAFFVPKGTMVELYATTLHYAPCEASEEGFKCIVILPKDTNLPLDKKTEQEGENGLLVAKNKWLIAHKEAAIEGAFIGLVGSNISIK